MKTCGECRHLAQSCIRGKEFFCNAPVPPWAYQTEKDATSLTKDAPYAEYCPIFDPIKWPYIEHD